MDIVTYRERRPRLVVATAADAAAVIDRGIDFLNHRGPTHWERAITRPVRVESHVWCPLSQVYARAFEAFRRRYPSATTAYDYALYELGLWESNDEAYYGFHALDRAAALLLDAGWLSVLRARRH